MITFTNSSLLYCKHDLEIKRDIYNIRIYGKINNRSQDRGMYHFISEPCITEDVYSFNTNELIYREEYTLPQNYRIYSEKNSLYMYLYL